MILALLLTACKSEPYDPDARNINKGTITIYAEASYQVLLDELIQSYENVYPESDITPVYASDADVITAFMQSKTRMMLIGTTLTPEQKKKIEQSQNMEPKEFKIGREAIAVISSLSNPDSVFDYDAFIASRSGDKTAKYANTGFVFNKDCAGMVSTLLGNTGAGANMFSLNNTDTVAGYIAKNTSAIGFISFASISDMDDPKVQALLQKVKVLSVAKRDTSGVQVVTNLSQATIASNDYPFQRYVTLVKGNTPELLGTGFVNFLYRSKAGRIILKAGLVPETMPERQIKIVE